LNAEPIRLLGDSDPWLMSAIYTHLEAVDLRGAIDRLETRPAEVRKAGA
jgi:hypothetical protein